MFLDAISQLNSGDYADMNNHELIYVVETPAKMLINFFAQYVILTKDEQSMKLGYDELALIVIRQADESISVVFNEKKFDYQAKNTDKGVEEKEFLESIKTAFADGVESSPYETVRLKCEEYGICFTGEYNKHLYLLLLKYSRLFENIVECDMLEENTKIEFLLEEHTAGLFDDASGTASNVAKSLLGGVSGVRDLAFAVGKKVAVSKANEFIGNVGVIVLTNHNGIYAKGSDTFTLGDNISDVLDCLDAERDPTISGALDVIYEDNGEKILDNVSIKRWSEFKKNIRKLKNQEENTVSAEISDDYYAENISVKDNGADDIDVISDKLSKLKNLLNEELITQEEYNIKKNEILGIKANNTSQENSTRPNKLEKVVAKPMQNTTIKNTAKENSSKSRLATLLLLLFFQGLGIYKFYVGRIKGGLALFICSIIGFYHVYVNYYVDILQTIGLLLLSFVCITLIIDFFKILTGNFKDKDGMKITEW